ncbi:MAG: hypothetical protein SPL08_00980 [Pseudomonadota bacterium]|nr:hypothetical protein [Pseudomonadota bacterium]
MNLKNKITCFVSADQRKNEELSDTFVRLIKNKKKSDEFLKIIIQNPRDNKDAYRFFCDSFRGTELKHRWYDMYLKIYTNFMNDLFHQVKHIEDILKIIPNLTPWTLEQRFGTIKVGRVPRDFISEKHFLNLISHIHNARVVKTFKRIKKLECHLPDFKKAFPDVKKIDWFDLTARSVFLKDLMQKKCGFPFFIHQDNIRYTVTFLCNPYSSKMVFRVQLPNLKTFILKLSPYRFLTTLNDRVRKEHENMAIRADSTYSDALLEFYLKLNECPHAPDILYYNYDYEVALYHIETGKPFHTGQNKNKYLDFCSFNTCVVPDSMNLGVYVNDINAGNFLLSDRDKCVKIIDIGHASFMNPLTPGVPGLTFTLGNLCGRDYLSVYGVGEVLDD